MRSWCRNALASNDCWVSSQNWHTFAQPKASLTGRNSMICSSHDMECKDERGGVQLKTAPQERLKAKRENKKDSKLWASKMGSWNSQIFKWVLMMFIYFYNVQNGMLHWVGLLCFYYRSAHGERVGCDRTTWLRRKNHRGSTQNNLNESTCLLDVSIFSSLKDFRKVAKCSEEISSKCGPHVVAEHQLGFVPLAAQDFQPKVSFCWLQKISMPTLFGVEFEPVFLRFCFKKGPHRRLLVSLKKSEIASFT